MIISAPDALGPAFKRMARVCFQPFSIGKWFIMGFCAFLSTCGQGGTNFNFSNPYGSRGSGPPPFVSEFKHFVSIHLALTIALAIVAFLLITCLWLVAVYLRCRGRFMFLDNVTRNRAAVVEPWHHYRTHANSYFWFSILMAIIGTVAFALIGTIGVIIALPDFQTGAITGAGISAIILTALLFIPTMLLLLLIQSFAYNFVLPIMMIRNSSFRPAWNEALRVVFRGHIGALALFYLFRFIISIVAVVIVFVAVCATCCIGGLPYLSSVLLLPLLVFDRMFALTFLEQFQPDYILIQNQFDPGSGFPVELNAPPLLPSAPPQPPAPPPPPPDRLL